MTGRMVITRTGMQWQITDKAYD